MAYTLNIQIDSNGVQNIQSAGQWVTIVKPVNAPGQRFHAAGPHVVWCAFIPQQENQLTWQKQYWLYETSIQHGIGSIGTTDGPARDGYSYVFEEDFKSPVNDLAPGSFGVLNRQGANNLSFGLAQAVQVNDDSLPPIPVNVIPVLNNERAIFQPEETVSVFLSAFFQDFSNPYQNGVVISEVTGEACTVTLEDNIPVTLSFDDLTNEFVVLPSSRSPDQL
ncbi:MAG TPA: hypothetical protein VHI31_04910 [Actinomycetota bacterium]|nr:hypothetical protein [Actinomycetota bacterium]